jgi:hypothetical protein
MVIREAHSPRNTADVLVSVAIGYFVICFLLSQVGRYLEHRTTPRLQAAVARRSPPRQALSEGRRMVAAHFRSPAARLTSLRRRS